MDIYNVQRVGDLLAANAYAGRGIIMGKTADGSKAALAYFIMGRSENSRNRIFVEQDEQVIINAFDPAKLADPSLIIYAPIKVYANHVIVTNGDQTDTIVEYLKEGKSFEDALTTREFEPDAPNLTARISGMISVAAGDFSYKLSILKSADAAGTACNRYVYAYTPLNGLGHFIHTYREDGNPLPTFTGEPKRVQIPNCIDEFSEEIWHNLNAENKISLYVRYLDLANGSTESRMINKNQL